MVSFEEVPTETYLFTRLCAQTSVCWRCLSGVFGISAVGRYDCGIPRRSSRGATQTLRLSHTDRRIVSAVLATVSQVSVSAEDHCDQCFLDATVHSARSDHADQTNWMSVCGRAASPACPHGKNDGGLQMSALLQGLSCTFFFRSSNFSVSKAAASTVSSDMPQR